MTTTRTERHGVEEVADVVPEGYVEVHAYTPSHTVTPSDSYGRRDQDDIVRAIALAGITATRLLTRRRRLFPMGTGPGGRVRFGDDMMPGTYRVAVPAADVPAAAAAILAHKAEVEAWLFQNGPTPRAYPFA